ncbi:MAG: LysR family transcriptional regulator [Betaproteobacteria bacterium]|nr:LysR family transcriptional regulator [Betaproteobacteria bacterium]
MNRLLPLHALRAFEAVARHLSVKKAAAELHVTPAAISHQVKLLEESCGRPLLVRRPRALALTDASRRALPQLSAGLGQLLEASATLREPRSAATLTVSVAPSFATCWLVPRLHRFLTAMPSVDVRVTARTRQSTKFGEEARREATAWLADADIAVLLSQGEFPDHHVEKLVSLSVTPLASPAMLRDGRLTLEDLRRHVLLHDDTGVLYDGRDYWELWLSAAGIKSMKLRHGAHLSHSVLALEAAAEGAGIVASLPEFARPQLDAGRLVAPFDLKVELPYAYYLVATPEALSHAPVRAFADWLRAQAGAG